MPAICVTPTRRRRGRQRRCEAGRIARLGGRSSSAFPGDASNRNLRGGAMTRDGNSGASLLFCKRASRRIAAGLVVGLCAAGWALPAAAYRPFDGTDAAVADVGEVEVELQPLGAARAGGTTRGLSDTIVNY